jgi:hypothetical protein
MAPKIFKAALIISFLLYYYMHFFPSSIPSVSLPPYLLSPLFLPDSIFVRRITQLPFPSSLSFTIPAPPIFYFSVPFELLSPSRYFLYSVPFYFSILLSFPSPYPSNGALGFFPRAWQKLSMNDASVFMLMRTSQGILFYGLAPRFIGNLCRPGYVLVCMYVLCL